MKPAARHTMSLVCAAAVLFSRCASDVVANNGREPVVAIVRLTVGNTLISIDSKGETTGGPIVLRAGVVVNVTAEFLNANGETLPGIVPATYQVNAVQSGIVPITFTRSNTDPFAGTVVCNLPNVTANLLFTLYNVEKQHDLWGPFDVAFTVSN